MEPSRMLPTPFLFRPSLRRAAARLSVHLVASVLVVLSLVGQAFAEAMPCEVSAASKLADGGDSDWSFARSSIAYDQPDSAGVYQLRSMDPQGNADVCLSCTPASGAPRSDRHKI